MTVDAAHAQEGSSRDFHNYEIEDPEIRSYDSWDGGRHQFSSRSGAIPPHRFSDNSQVDEVRFFSPVTPVETSFHSQKKKPKHVQPIKKSSLAGSFVARQKNSASASTPGMPHIRSSSSLELVLSPRSAFDDCSVNSSLSESTSQGGGRASYRM